jgi:carbamoyltransferase
MRTGILGISAFYHDSAAAILIDGELIAAAQEERFTRTKHDSGFPSHSIKYVLEEAGMDYNDLTAVTFYEKPFLKFERLLETYHAFAPKGLVSFTSAVPLWIKEKLFMRRLLQEKLQQFGTTKIPLLFPEHHLSHAASAFYPSPFDEAAILTIDGVGEWATSTISYGNSGDIRVIKEMHFPHSLGLLYSAFTYYLGFRVNSGEYKLMGLAPYGNPNSSQTKVFKEKILAELVDIREDGSILLNMNYFDFATRLTMTNNRKWEALFGLQRRKPESVILQEHMNLALAIQDVTEFIVVALAGTAQKITNSRNLVLAGGVALNCAANSKILNAGIFDNIWIQPAAGDAGGAVGAAFAAFHIRYKKERKVPLLHDSMNHSYLGPQYSDKDILQAIDKYDAQYEYYRNFNDLSLAVSQKISEGNVIGWFQDRMEFGPRALGNRSILGDPRNPEIQKVLNLKIKFREGFRPFAPSILIEDLDHYYTTMVSSPYMLFIGSLKKELRNPEPENYVDFNLHDRLYHIRSGIPAVTHVDYSSRIQTVGKEANPKFWQLITDFKKITGCGILVNTSFNVRGEPIVCTPKDAYMDFMRSDMDYLVLGNYLFDRKKQKQFSVKHPEKIVIFAD